MGQILV